jgi:hypothetical protein
MTTIEKYTPAVPAPHAAGANLIREAAAVMVDAKILADAICNTQMVPKHFFGKPEECAAAMLYGASLGFDPMQSVKQIYVVHGMAALYARAMVALLQGAGHEVWTVASTDDAVTVAGRRRGSEHVEESTWDYARAKKAGYTRNEKYSTDPQAMLYAKAASEVCRKVAPDVLSGIYSVEELQAEQVASEVVAVRRTGGLGAALASKPSGAVAGETVGDTGTQRADLAQPAAPTAPESPLLDTKSPIAVEMYEAIEGAGITGDYVYEFLTQVAERPITASRELTEDDARKVIAQLSQAVEITNAGDQG